VHHKIPSVFSSIFLNLILNVLYRLMMSIYRYVGGYI